MPAQRAVPVVAIEDEVAGSRADEHVRIAIGVEVGERGHGFPIDVREADGLGRNCAADQRRRKTISPAPVPTRISVVPSRSKSPSAVSEDVAGGAAPDRSA
jgi:hypothetical protein